MTSQQTSLSPTSDNDIKRPFTLGFGRLGNGLTVWNSERDVAGDYEQVAHISESGTLISWRVTALPLTVIKEVEAAAKRQEITHNRTLAQDIEAQRQHKLWLLGQGYSVEQVEKRYGKLDYEPDPLILAAITHV